MKNNSRPTFECSADSVSLPGVLQHQQVRQQVQERSHIKHLHSCNLNRSINWGHCSQVTRTSNSRSLRTIIENCQCSQHTNWKNNHTRHMCQCTLCTLTLRNCTVSSIVLLSSIIFLVKVMLCWVLESSIKYLDPEHALPPMWTYLILS